MASPGSSSSLGGSGAEEALPDRGSFPVMSFRGNGPERVFRILTGSVAGSGFPTSANQKSKLSKSVHSASVVPWFSSVYLAHHTFRLLTYGDPPLSKAELQSLRWKASWNILIRKR